MLATKQQPTEIGTDHALVTRLSRANLRVRFMIMAMIVDSLVIAAIFYWTDNLRGLEWLPVNFSVLTIIAVPAYIYFGLIVGAFSTSSLIRISTSYVEAIRAFLNAMVFLIVCSFVAKFSINISRVSLLVAVIAVCGALAVSRALMALAIRRVTKATLMDRLLITDREDNDYPETLNSLQINASALKVSLDNPDTVSTLSRIVAQHDIVYLDCSDERERRAWITLAKASGAACEVIVRDTAIQEAVGLGNLGKRDTLVLSRGPLSLESRLKKRIFDLFFASILLVICAPLMVAVAILIKLESPGPALFRQKRIGQANLPFDIFKFRSMRQASSDADGTRSTARDDERITPIGSFIRKTSIDELPQLFNVMLGTMSLVGPRPHARGSRAGEQLFWEVSELYWVRHALKPGITGLAQINGYRGATHRKNDLEERLRYDLEYLQSWSLWSDFKILLATAKVVSHSNAY